MRRKGGGAKRDVAGAWLKVADRRRPCAAERPWTFLRVGMTCSRERESEASEKYGQAHGESPWLMDSCRETAPRHALFPASTSLRHSERRSRARNDKRVSWGAYKQIAVIAAGRQTSSILMRTQLGRRAKGRFSDTLAVECRRARKDRFSDQPNTLRSSTSKSRAKGDG